MPADQAWMPDLHIPNPLASETCLVRSRSTLYYSTVPPAILIDRHTIVHKHHLGMVLKSLTCATVLRASVGLHAMFLVVYCTSSNYRPIYICLIVS